MKTKLMMIGALAAACVVQELAAMPTEDEARRAEPVVKKLLAQERAALNSGKMTRSEVAAAAMKLADEADTDAAKLLLMKGAFVLYVKDGNLEKAVETMNALEAAISDMPPQSVTNMIEAALLGVREKEAGARLYKMLGETKADIPSCIDLPSHIESKAIAASVKERSSVASILKGMIKLPGHDYWLSSTELTQGQWESVMGYNPSSHKGANLPVDNVSRDDCDVFLEMLNKTKEVQASRFEFELPVHGEWAFAAAAGCVGGWKCWSKPGVQGNILEREWVKENSSNQTHAVAQKVANAFGFYDMQGNVSEWFLSGGEKGQIMGSSIYVSASNKSVDSPVRLWYDIPRNRRKDDYGLRLAAHIRSKSSSGGQRSLGSLGAESAQHRATVDGYTWSYRMKNGEAMIVTTNGLCAVSPSPKGDVSIPSTLGGTKVTSIGNHAFRNCRGLTSVTIPADVTSIGDGAFDGCRELKSVTIPYSVRNIGEWAFANCYALKSVTIPPNMERIGGGAFIHCRGLTSVTIPAKVVSIGGVAFGYCSALRQIKVDAANQSFTSIDGVLYTKDQSVLLVCPNALTSVKIPKGVTNIGGWAFEGCNGVKSVTIPEGVTTIENNAFKECGGLESVVMLSGVKKIGELAFYNCRSLRSMTIPEGVCDIGVSAFEGCGELTSLALPQGLTKIGGNAFRGLGKLTSVTIPESVTDIGGAIFSYCGGLTQINVEAGNQKYTSDDGVLYTKDLTELVMCPNGLTSVTIPESVTSIGLGAFIGCDKLTSLLLPSSVKSIGSWAFEGCNGLTSVTIPESVTKIEQWAFLNCGGLTSVTMRGERPDAPNNIFQGCGKLKSIHVPANAKSWEGMKDWLGIPLIKPVQSLLRRPSLLRRSRKVGEQQHGEDKRQATVDGYTWSYRVYNGEAIIEAEKDGKCAVSPAPKGDISIPATLGGAKVMDIGPEAFRNCSGLKSVTLPSGLKDVAWGAFGRCVGLTSVVIPEGVTNIWYCAFIDCSGLKNVVIPSSVTSIGERAFLGCRELTSVTIPARVANIGEGAFGGCSELKQINLASDNQAFTLVDGVLYPKDMSVLLACPGTMTSVTIPSGVTKIGALAFMGCNGLESVTIPASVTSIGWCAFRACGGLGSMTIPESVKEIGFLAFKDCGELTSVTMRGERPNASPDIFKGCGKLKSIHVPANAKSWAGMKDWLGIPLVFDAEAARHFR